ncbi:MAG TPA: type II toxin-antitoxin system VapC family toxin [Thermoanaerobaculia bacterium]|nr:type II toxin-antitoxin system VapC family toxin [Thermoanaerobaculia bacterium]
MRPRVYIETSIPSFYFESRTAPDMVARRDWTQQWWEQAMETYEPITSAAVIAELSRGNFPNRDRCLELMATVPVVTIEPAVFDIVKAYIANHVMPNDPVGDALHLALSSYHKCDFLLTWNCRQLANANKFGHIRRINTLLGLFVPSLVTPLELLGVEDEKDKG